ncbi:MAG TPA: MBL fold metallo-hydrolase, partial [Ktedonobacterales bacterium]|nr:MBL fold metallo-hydrolase [Ktedonobacterales bacterium]
MELLPNIHLIEGVTSSAYLIVEPEGLTVIDTGLPGSGDKIVRYLRRIGQEAGAVRRILLTHQHADHVGGAARLAALSGAQVI